MGRKKVSVISKDKNGRNQTFRDNYKKRVMSKNDFVKRINRGEYPDHHVRKINGVSTPVTNPDSTKNNNLG